MLSSDKQDENIDTEHRALRLNVIDEWFFFTYLTFNFSLHALISFNFRLHEHLTVTLIATINATWTSKCLLI